MDFHIQGLPVPFPKENEGVDFPLPVHLYMVNKHQGQNNADLINGGVDGWERWGSNQLGWSESWVLE